MCRLLINVASFSFFHHSKKNNKRFRPRFHLYIETVKSGNFKLFKKSEDFQFMEYIELSKVTLSIPKINNS